MEQRKLERFRKRVILIHWLEATSFAILLVTGAIMFFDLPGLAGGRQIRVIHQVAAVFFVVIPVMFAIFDPRAAMSFLKNTVKWDRDDREWLRKALGYYFGKKADMPPQGYLNGDQKLWQLVVLNTGLIFMLTGVLMWFFKFKIPVMLYQWILLTHEVAFIVISFSFLVHLYLTMLHPGFEESLSAMVNGKISASYARNHYSKWYEEKAEK